MVVVLPSLLFVQQSIEDGCEKVDIAQEALIALNKQPMRRDCPYAGR